VIFLRTFKSPQPISTRACSKHLCHTIRGGAIIYRESTSNRRPGLLCTPKDAPWEILACHAHASATLLIGLDLAIFANNTAHSMPCVRLTVSLCLLRAPIPSSTTCSAPPFQRCVLGLSAWLGGHNSFPPTETMSQAAIDNITCPGRRGRVSEVQKGRSRGARWIHYANARLPCMP